MTEKEIIDALKVPGGSITLGVTESAPVKKKPMPVIKKGDMSPETKALPDEVVKPPKGIGESEKDMDPIPAKKKGGVIKDLKKAGFYDAKKDKAKRLDIINKVTTKPERIEMVDKMFSAKKMAKGGSVSSASKRADGCATKGKTRGKIC